METSTLINFQAQKKHSLIQKFIPIDESLGDIESEIQSRRLEAINKSTETRRRSAAPLLAGYTASQLSQHCKDVIKLSTENKINSKNAFNFWLIDVMAAMSKKRDSEINKNFQVASCTLDASVKIYGYRVDAIHTDAFKMVGGFFNKEMQATDDGGEEGIKSDKGEEAAAKTKMKKKRKKLTVVPPENLNTKSEGEILLEVIPEQNFLSRKTDGNDLLVKIPTYNDGCLLLLDSDYPCWPYGNNSTVIPKLESGKIFDDEMLMSLAADVQISSDDDLCAFYRNFEFGQIRQSGDSDDDLQTSQNSDRFEFDINASIHDVSLEEQEDQRNRIHIPAGGIDSDQEIIVEPKKAKSVNLAISDMKTRLSVNPSEYSVFDEAFFKAWAGPAHWKVKPMRKPLEEFSNKEDISKPFASKRTRKGKIKSHAGLFEIIEDVLEKNLAESEKTTLFKSTMLNWNPQNTTMPKDLKCQSSSLFSLYHIPSYVITFKNDVADTSEISDHYNEEEQNEVGEFEYCSPSIVRDDNESHHTDDELHNLSGDDEAWDLGNMVEAPHKIEKIHIATFKRRKHVDIKHLKQGLWNILTKSEVEGEKRVKVEEAIEFTKLIKSYPVKFSKGFTSLPSAPLIFNALLHLTNEKCLVLAQNKSNILNFVISQ